MDGRKALVSYSALNPQLWIPEVHSICPLNLDRAAWFTPNGSIFNCLLDFWPLEISLCYQLSYLCMEEGVSYFSNLTYPDLLRRVFSTCSS